MKASDFLYSLQQKGVDRLTRPVLFLGEEEYWMVAGINRIKQLLFQSAEEDFNVVVMETKEVEASLLGTELATAPFFSSRRLIILKGLEELKAAHEETLLAALPHLPPEVFLVLTARNLDQRKKGVKQLKTFVETVYCEPLKSYEAKGWLRQEAKALGLDLAPHELDLLLEAKGTSLFSLKNELEKIKTYCAHGAKPASMAEWHTLLGEAGETNIFAMIDGAIEGKTGVALNLLQRLLAAGEPETKILALLGNEVRRMLFGWFLLQNGRGHEIQKELGCHPYVAEKIRKKAAGLTFTQLRRAHQRILAADYRLKTGQTEPGLELYAVVLDLGSCLTEK
ncbi:DNA polymerase III subunit delta [Capillibacterium thermochitinicola]|uniref:DNA polymerase III subunit delta n=1 Tax=Capillibacterium thermochitinicola TaxID=2699427 RepID=A0A8J6LIK8_9FIRM|nr:DNA polymerase III subunit delta [Capillibacterium thermochitinicola]MBA2133130.1 DNA polymerase III subunit delta [Capillibacterium thermochitinicola]